VLIKSLKKLIIHRYLINFETSVYGGIFITWFAKPHVQNGASLQIQGGSVISGTLSKLHHGIPIHLFK
jgi:hypothetical protein